MTTSFHGAIGRALMTGGRCSVHSSSVYTNWTIHLPDHHCRLCALKFPGARLALKSMLGARLCAGAAKVLVAQSCLTLCDPMDSRLSRRLCPWDFPGKNTGVGCHSFFQAIFLTQGSNLGLPHCKQIVYRLSSCKC